MDDTTETQENTGSTDSLDPAIAAIPESERPAPGSIEEAAIKIDRIMGTTPSEEEVDEDLRYHGEVAENENAETEEGEVSEVNEANLSDDQTLKIDLEDGETEVTIGQLKKVFENGREFVGEVEGLRAQSQQAQHMFASAEESLNRLIPALNQQLNSEYADIQSPQDLELLAATDPLRRLSGSAICFGPSQHASPSN